MRLTPSFVLLTKSCPCLCSLSFYWDSR